MAYSRAKLQRVGQQNRNAPSLFCYSDTAVALTAIDAAGYFNDAADILKVGDFIFANASSGTAGIFLVNANSRDLTATPPVEGVVDVANALSVGTIDSD
jgi:hypothetical protein